MPSKTEPRETIVNVKEASPSDPMGGDFVRQGLQAIQAVNRGLSRMQSELAYLVNAQAGSQAGPRGIIVVGGTPQGVPIGYPAPSSSPYSQFASATNTPFATPPFAVAPFANAPLANTPFGPFAGSPYAQLAGQQAEPPGSWASLNPQPLPPQPNPWAQAGNPTAFAGGIASMQQTGRLLGGPDTLSGGYEGLTPQPFRHSQDLANAPPTNRVPFTDLIDEGSEYLIRIEVPGVSPDKLDIVCYPSGIVCTARSESDIPDGTLLLAESGRVLFRRAIELPSEIKTHECKAALQDGILTVHLAKQVPTEGPRQIDVAYR